MRKKKPLLIAAIVIVAAAAAIGLGYWSGEHVAGDAMKRVELLVRYQDLSKADQEVIARSSLECRLNQVPLEAHAVSACLREGAAALEKKGVERKYVDGSSQSWSAPMERLLRGQAPAQQKG